MTDFTDNEIKLKALKKVKARIEGRTNWTTFLCVLLDNAICEQYPPYGEVFVRYRCLATEMRDEIIGNIDGCSTVESHLLALSGCEEHRLTREERAALEKDALAFRFALLAKLITKYEELCHENNA